MNIGTEVSHDKSKLLGTYIYKHLNCFIIILMQTYSNYTSMFAQILIYVYVYTSLNRQLNIYNINNLKKEGTGSEVGGDDKETYTNNAIMSEMFELREQIDDIRSLEDGIHLRKHIQEQINVINVELRHDFDEMAKVQTTGPANTSNDSQNQPQEVSIYSAIYNKFVKLKYLTKVWHVCCDSAICIGAYVYS